MKIKSSIHLITTIILVCIHSKFPISCNPIAFDPTSAPVIAMPPMPLPAPIIVGSQFDPFASIQSPAQYILTSPFGSTPFDSNRRSISGIFRSTDKKSNKSPDDPSESDVQKALGDIPISFIEPEGPSTISERISDSFSALGEGVRNHFRSITENFSDTMDELKDAWRLSDNSRERS